MSEDLNCKNYRRHIRYPYYVGILNGHTDVITKICTYRPEDNRIISTSADKTSSVWKLTCENGRISGSIMSTMVGHSASISDGSLSRYYGFLSTSSYDKTVKLWDMNKGECQRTFSRHTDEVLSVTFDELEQRIVSGSKDCTLRLWDVYSKKKVKNVQTHSSPITCLNVLKDQPKSAFISAGQNGEVLQWDLLKFSLNKKYLGHRGNINSLSISDDSTKMIVGGRAEEVTIWDIGIYKRCERFPVHGNVKCVSISPLYHICAIAEGEIILLYNFDVPIPYYTLITRNLNLKTPPKVTALSWSDDSKYLYVGYDDGSIRVFRFKLGYLS